MEFFRFVPSTIIALTLLNTMAMAMPSPQTNFNVGSGFSQTAVGGGGFSQTSAAAAPPPAAAPTNTRFLGFGSPQPQQQQFSQPQQFSNQRPQQQQQQQQQQQPAPAPTPNAGPGRFLGFNNVPQNQRPTQQVFGGLGPAPAVNVNPNQGIQNLAAGAGLGGVAAFAGANCLFQQNCDLAFRPSLGASIDANGQIVPQLGITTQVGDGRDGVGTTFTSGLQLNTGKGENGPIGGFVAGGLNDGNIDGVGIGAQTGFGLNGNSQGGLDATAQLGGNIQAPQLAGVQFNRPNTALGVQPTVLGQAQPQLNPLNLFRPQQGGQQNIFSNLFGGR